MPLRTLIVEDEPFAVDQLRMHIASRPDIDLIGEARDGKDAISKIDELAPDLVLLDIRLPECSGIDVLKKIKESPAVVFVTAYDSFALAAFELGAFDYLLKPFSADRFHAAVDRTAERIRQMSGEPSLNERIDAIQKHDYLERFFVRHLGQTIAVRTADVVRFDAEDDYTAIRGNGRKLLIHLSMRSLESRLNPKHFLRVHRSVIVNLAHIRSVSQVDRRLEILLSDGSTVTASRSRTPAVHALRLP